MGSIDITGPDRRLFIQCRRHNIFYAAMNKCGCTYVKNVLFYLDHGFPHFDQPRIHQSGFAIKAGDKAFAECKDRKVGFAVLREPVSRFFSFYFNKMLNETTSETSRPLSFDIRDTIAFSYGIDLREGADIETHRRNCMRLLDFIAENLAGKTELPVNTHWLPQAYKADVLRKMDGIAFIPLPRLQEDLLAVLAPIAPDAAEAMRAVTTENKGARPVAIEDVVDGALRDRIADVYGADFDHYAFSLRQSDERVAKRPEVAAAAMS